MFNHRTTVLVVYLPRICISNTTMYLYIPSFLLRLSTEYLHMLYQNLYQYKYLVLPFQSTILLVRHRFATRGFVLVSLYESKLIIIARFLTVKNDYIFLFRMCREPKENLLDQHIRNTNNSKHWSIIHIIFVTPLFRRMKFTDAPVNYNFLEFIPQFLN